MFWLKRIHFNTCLAATRWFARRARRSWKSLKMKILQANALNMGNHILADSSLEKLKAEAQHHRRRARQGLDAWHRTGEGPQHQGARAKVRMRPGAGGVPRTWGCCSARGGLYGSVIRFAPPMCITKTRTRTSCWKCSTLPRLGDSVSRSFQGFDAPYADGIRVPLFNRSRRGNFIVIRHGPSRAGTSLLNWPLRWAHVFAGIMWVGTATLLFSTWLDGRFVELEESAAKG